MFQIQALVSVGSFRRQKLNQLDHCNYSLNNQKDLETYNQDLVSYIASHYGANPVTALLFHFV